MAKRYDPIMCMMVEEPTKAQDAKVKDKLVKVPDSKLKDFEANLRSAGFKVASKSGRGMSTHYQVEVNSSKTFTEADLKEWANKIDAVCDKMDSVAPTTWNIGLTADGKITAGLDVREMHVKDAEKLHYYQHSYTKKWYVVSPDGKVFKEFNTEAEAKNYVNGKAHDANTLYETFAHGNSKHAGVLEMNGKAKVVVWNEGDNPRTGKVTVIGEDTPANRSKAKSMLDSASALDKAIATTDGMFASAFGEYTKGAKFKKEKFLKELAGISDAEELAKRIQTLDNELRKNLERLDEAYNVAAKDYYAARNEIRSIMDAFSREAFSLYKKLDKK